MNRTLIEILQNREDLSEYLFHFTKGKKANKTLDQIIQSNAILDINNRGVICFSEAPITLLIETFNIFKKYQDPLYAPYGIGIKKDHLFELGARPVIYGSLNEKKHLSKELKWRFEEYIPKVKDFSWLREWRIQQKQVKIDVNESIIITKSKRELHQIAFPKDEIIDIQIDGCVADGQLEGTATGIIGRSFKGISFQDLQELNRLSKENFHKLVDNQNMEDRSEVNLGSFLM
jgi:hypothetical protein